MAAGDLQRGPSEKRVNPRTTIFALATGAPPTAIAIVRISGPRALAVTQAIIGSPPPPARELVRRALCDPATGEVIDEGMAVVFPAPASATGDDMAELHLHGGTAVIAAVLAMLDRQGLAAAGPGAFTRRAFDNGKLDLGQVEAVGDLVAAETEGQRRAALARSGGDVARHVNQWRAMLLACRADVEATLDFAEEEGVDIGLGAINREGLEALLIQLRDAHVAATRGALMRAGVTVAIVGPVNAGKSTLLNALARRDVAMVSPHPGTTRDVIEVRLALNGIPTTLIDTAGLRATDDSLESEGIIRGAARAAAADVVISLGPSEHANVIRVAAKADLRAAGAGWHGGVLHLSAATGDGLALLEAELTARVKALATTEAPIVAHRWQIAALAEAADAVEAAMASTDVVVIADELRRVTGALGRLLGQVVTDDILDQIFSRFCIGK